MGFRRLCFGVLLWLAGLLSGTTLGGQSAPPPEAEPVATFQTNVRVALVDVVVTDKKGDTVAGLLGTDFQVLEDGKPEAISSFEEHRE